MRSNLTQFKDFLTWMPSIFFPGSHLAQIRKMLIEQSGEGVSAITFAGYFFGNVGAYLFAAKYSDIRTILSFLFTAVLEVVIVAMKAYYNGNYGIMKIVIAASLVIFGVMAILIVSRGKWMRKHADAAGIFPAIMFPGATIIQYVKVLNQKNIRGVSCTGWIMQVLANLGAYLLIDKLTNPQNILAFLGTAIVDILIIIAILRKTGKCFDTKSIF